MKKFISYFMMMLLLSIAVNSQILLAQEEETEEAEEESYEEAEDESYEVNILKYWQEEYTLEFKNVLFEDVSAAITQVVTEQNACAVIPSTSKVNDDGLMKQVIKSDFCIFAMGDTTYRDMRRYSVLSTKETIKHKCLPFIPGARWENGRIQYKFIVREVDEETITVLLKNCEISGKDQAVTNKVHFWESNGVLETNTMAKIKEIVENK